jgi:uncharacterized protein YbaP (TraB family)
MFKNLSYIFSLLLILTSCVEAKSLLYKVKSKTSTVYILGSIHLAKPELYPLAEEIEKAYTESDALVLELDPMSAESMQGIQEAMQKDGQYAPGKTLKSELSSKTYAALEAYASKSAFPLQQMQNLKPWVITLQLSIAEMMRLGYSPDLGIDMHFLHKAKAEQKPILELENAQDQMALLSKDDKGFQNDLLFYTLESMHELEPMLEKMFTSWTEGKAEAFDEIMIMPIEENKHLQKIYDVIITERNHTMSKKIEGFLQTDSRYFVVVGAGHVVGDEGIISLLKQKGFKPIQQ